MVGPSGRFKHGSRIARLALRKPTVPGLSHTSGMTGEADIPTHWYNVMADLPVPFVPPLVKRVHDMSDDFEDLKNQLVPMNSLRA